MTSFNKPQTLQTCPLPLCPAAQQNVWFGILLDIGMVGYALAGLTMAPQATLLYWLSNNAFYLGLQNALARPSVVKALGLPAVMLPHPKHDKDARGGLESGVCGSTTVNMQRPVLKGGMCR
jgi:hypothetical protein